MTEKKTIPQYKKEIEKGMEVRNELMLKTEGKFVANHDRKPLNRKARRELNKQMTDKRGKLKL